MTSLGPDWRHDKPCRCYGLPDLLRVPIPSSCGRFLTAKGLADTVWVCNVTVCAWLLSFWSWVRSLLLVPTACCSCSENCTTLYHRYSDSLLSHAQAHAQHCITGTQRLAAVASTSTRTTLYHKYSETRCCSTHKHTRTHNTPLFHIHEN